MVTRARASYEVALDDKVSPAAKRIETSMRSVGSGMAAIEGPLGGVAGRLSTVNALLSRGGAVWAAFGVGIAGVTLGIGRMLSVGAEWERQQFRTEALLRSTGNAAGKTRAELEELADDIDRRTLASAAGVRDAQAALLSFTSVRGEQFERVLRLSQDMVATFGGDLRGAAIQLGKALEDPERGLNALRRSGVSFTSTQRDLIVAMFDAGKQADAQTEILDRLQEQVGGAGEGEAKGLSGAVDGLVFEWNEWLVAVANTGPIYAAAQAINYLRAGAEGWRQALFDTDQDRFNRKMGRLVELREQLAKLDEDQAGGLASPTVLETRRAQLQRLIEQQESEIRGLQETYQAQQRAASAGLNSPRNPPDPDTPGRTRRVRIDEGYEEGLAHFRDMLREEARARDEAEAPMRRMVEERNRLVQGLQEEFDLLGKSREEQVRYRLEKLEAQPVLVEYGTRLAAEIDLHEKLRREQEEAQQAVRDLGLAFSSAFEDAIVNGNDLRDVLAGLLQDIGRLVVRRTVTEPLAAAFSGSGILDSLGGIFDIFRADGGPVKAGMPYIVGERRPELFVPKSDGMILPSVPGGGASVVQHIQIDARGADDGVEQRIRAAMLEAERRAVIRVRQEMRRGGPLSRIK